MKLRTSVIALAIAASAILTGGVLRAQSNASSATESYAIDPVHSSVVYRIIHGGVAPFYGTFTAVEGGFDWNAGNPAESSFDVTVPVSSVATGNAKRDGHLKSPDFFNAVEYPTITFKSTRTARAGDKSFNVTGDLTMHGVTKPVTAKVEFIGKGSVMNSSRAGFDVGFTVKRSDFGMDYGVENGMLGDEVKLMIGIEGVQQ